MPFSEPHKPQPERTTSQPAEEPPLRVAIGADHAGFTCKQQVAEQLGRWGYAVIDVGTHTASPSDYPDFAEAVGLAVLKKRADRGIVICGSGVGASIAANKMPGIRAGTCHDLYSARQGVEDDDMNVLVLGARIIAQDVAQDIARTFLQAEFSGADRHMRRLDKIGALMARYEHDAFTEPPNNKETAP